MVYVKNSLCADGERKPLTVDTVNHDVKVLGTYAMRGPLAIRARKIESELKEGIQKPFPDVIQANLGDCHAMGQVPITFIRQVLSLCFNPELLDSQLFPSDVKERARRILASCRGGSLGSYTDSIGLDVIRQDVAKFIERRDGGIPCQFEDIILTAGASAGIRGILTMMNRASNGKPPGVMIPVPQFMLYAATIAEYGMNQISYFLDEDNNWSLDIPHLQQAITTAREHCNPSVLVVLNPGNPTGQILTEDNICAIVQFAHEENLLIMADEVYQDNVCDPNCKFHSFKKVMAQMGFPYDKMQLASFYSTSKGYTGECGVRGGYMELVNFDAQVMNLMAELMFTNLCPTTAGQVCVDCVVNPPTENEPSHKTFMREKNTILKSLAERSKLVTESLNSIPGVHCNVVQGAMYAFPRLDLPQRFIDKAKSMGMEPCFYYALQLLENTGISVVPGSAYGQKPDTYHFRTTILPKTDQLRTMLDRLRVFHTNLMQS